MRLHFARVCGAAFGVALLASAPARAQGVTDAELTFNTGLNYLKDGRTELAIESFKKAIKQDSKNAYFYKGLGVALTQYADRCPVGDAKCRQGRLEQAVSASRKALELNPYYVDARNDLGTALLLTGKREAGKDELRKAYEDPTNPTPEISARNLGQAYLEEKDYAQAESWARTAAQRNKNYSDAQLLLADAQAAQGKLSEALAGLESAVAGLPNDPALLLALGQAYYRAGRFSEAKARLEQAAGKDPAGPSGRAAVELLKKFPK